MPFLYTKLNTMTVKDFCRNYETIASHKQTRIRVAFRLEEKAGRASS